MESITNGHTPQEKDKLGIYTVEYSQNMDELGKTIRDLIEEETKQSTNKKKQSWEICATS